MSNETGTDDIAEHARNLALRDASVLCIARANRAAMEAIGGSTVEETARSCAEDITMLRSDAGRWKAPPGRNENELVVILTFDDLELLDMAIETERASCHESRDEMYADLQRRLSAAWTAAGERARARTEVRGA